MNREEKHLSIEQIECLIETQPGVLRSPAPSELLEEAHRHLVTCEACQKLVSMHQEFDRTLRGLGFELPKDVTSECPPPQALNELAAGVTHSEEAEKVLRHALQCNHCGPLLRQAAEAFGTQETADEEALLSSLQTNRPEWQQSVAQKLASMNIQGGSKPSSPFSLKQRVRIPIASTARWIYVAAAIVLCTGVASIMFWRSRPNYANQLLAQAYSEQRILELRIPGARYAPLRVQRAGEDSRFMRPPSLLEAEGIIVRNLVKYPDDPKWLQAKARADLLDGNYDSALHSLSRALEVQPKSPGLIADIGSVYFQRALETNQQEDYTKAAERFEEALRLRPDDSVAQFNDAIVSEHLFLYGRAIDDWERFLRMDPNGDWSGEARQRLNAIREKQRQREHGLAQPLLRPEEFAVLDVTNLEIRRGMNGRIEEYASLALREWLPHAYPLMEGDEPKQTNLKSGVMFVAEVLKRDHDDPWLLDLLRSVGRPSFPAAADALAKTLRASDSGNYEVALREALEAEHLFATAGNAAGVHRAQVERIYALHLSHEGAACLRGAKAIEATINLSPFRWLRIQLQIEKAICMGLMGDLGNAQLVLKQAVGNAERSGYQSLYLRALANAAEMELGGGNLNSGWTRASEGLSRFWSTVVPPMQGYNLYYRLYCIAEQNRQPALQVAIWREALSLIDTDEDFLLRAMAHSTMGDAAISAGMTDLANREFSEASRLFAASPPGNATTNDKTEAGTLLAAAMTRGGRLEEAADLLNTLQPEMVALSNNYIAIQFYAVMGDVQLRRKELGKADSALDSAVALAESSLHSLKSESDRMAWSEQTGTTYREVVQLKLLQGNSVGALDSWELYRSSALGARRTGRAENKSTDDGQNYRRALRVQQEISDPRNSVQGAARVVYAFLGDGLEVWTQDENGVTADRISLSAAQAEQTLRHFLELCSDPESDRSALRSQARGLYDLLLAPVESRLGILRSLVIETDGPLDELPFEALIDRRNREVADTNSVQYSFGPYFRSTTRSKPTISSQSRALVVGVRAPAIKSLGSFPVLVDGNNEAEAVAQHFAQVRLLEDKRATLEQVRQELPKASLFHFVGHATTSQGRSGIVLIDKLFTSEDLSSQKLDKMDLVVLSACDTGKGSYGGSTDYDSLVRAFVRGGTMHVVASRWRIDSAATNSFMNVFYKRLLAGKSVPESVQDAARALRVQKETSHPYYWAAFRAFGQV